LRSFVIRQAVVVLHTHRVREGVRDDAPLVGRRSPVKLRGLILLSVPALPLLTAAQDPPGGEESLELLWKAFAAEIVKHPPRDEEHESDVKKALLSAARETADPAVASKVLKEKFDLPESACSPFLKAFLLHDRVEREDRWRKHLEHVGLVFRPESPSPALLRAMRSAESAYREAFLLAPANATVVREAASFYSDFSGDVCEDPMAALLDLAERSPALGTSGFYAALGLPHWHEARRLLRSALAESPGNPAVLAALAAKTSNPCLRAALRMEAIASLGQREDGADERVLTSLWEGRLADLLQMGLTAVAFAEWSALPPATRERILGGEELKFVAKVRGLSWSWPLVDIRYLVAGMLYFERGPGEAASYLEEASWRSALAGNDGSFFHGPGDYPLLVGLIEAVTAEALPREDPLEFIDLVERHARTPPWLWIFCRYLERAGYEDFAAQRLEERLEALEDLMAEGSSEEPPMPGRALAEAEDLRTRVCEVSAALERDLARLEARLRPEPASVEDPMAETIRRLLRSPRLDPFAEKPLPPGMKPLRLGEEEAESKWKELAKDLLLPDGISPVRIWRGEKDVVVIGASQCFDPTGEVSGGGYWLLRSTDGGRTWNRPACLGLRIFAPYAVAPFSELPLLSGELLQLEVEICELDERSITLPPLSLRFKRVRGGLFLEAPLAAIEEDRDGDGLTDLAEEQLLTDPLDRDTDGDGLEDGRDSFPHVPRIAQPDPRADLLEAVVWHQLHYGPAPPIVEAVGVRPGPLETLPDAAFAEVGAIFLQGDRRLLRSCRSPRRVVVLSRDEIRAAQRKFGWFLPCRIRDLLISRDGKRARLEWNEGWCGGHVEAEWKDGEWDVRMTGFWVS
jgi:hypothetical protein